VGVEASLRAFAEGLRLSLEPPPPAGPAERPVPAMPPPSHAHPAVDALLKRVHGQFSEAVRPWLGEGLRRTIDYQDPAYGALYLERMARIAHDVEALLFVDMAHIAGLVAAELHPSPFPHADIVTTTTHKTLRGPRGGLIFGRAELARQIDRIVTRQSPYALLWNINASRLLYWNKFGMPPTVLGKYGDERAVLDTWWHDEDSAAELKAAQGSGATLPARPASVDFDQVR
jgi:hypothetical protein